MKRVLLSCLAVLMTACAAQPGPYHIMSFWPVDCANPVAPANVYQGTGQLDVGPGGPASFIVGTTVTGQSSQPGTVVNGITLEQPDRNQGVIKQVVVSYKLSRSLGASPAQFITNVTAPLKGDTDLVVQLISPELSDLLVNSLSAARDLSDTVDITANVEFKGTFAGDGHAFTTGSLDFPIRAYKSGDCGPATSTTCFYQGQVTPDSTSIFACP